MKIRKGDMVMVIAGKDKGKTGKVEHTYAKTEQVTVEGINVATKHQKNRRMRSQGQIVEIPMPIHVSNVSLMEGKKAVRVGYKVEGDKKVRVSRATGKTI